MQTQFTLNKNIKNIPSTGAKDLLWNGCNIFMLHFATDMNIHQPRIYLHRQYCSRYMNQKSRRNEQLQRIY